MGGLSSKKSFDIELSKTNVRENILKKKMAKQKCEERHRRGQIRTKRSCCWKFGFSMLLSVFLLNIIIGLLMWFSNVYNDSFSKILTFSEEGFLFNLWKDASVPRLVSVYPFNYTNYKAVIKGIEVPHVEQLGPYVFRETITKVNIKFHENGTLTFQENRTHEYDAELSKGSLSDIVVLPNFPVLAAHNLEGSNVLEWGGVSLLKFATMPDDFVTLKAEEIIWGYDDRFSLVSRTLKNVLVRSDDAARKFGILSMRNGLSPDKITMGTGIPDENTFAQITRYNGKSTIGAWDDKKCDKIEGSDGSLFAKHLITPNSTIYIFAKELCRKLPMVYEKQIMSGDGLPAYRYRLPGDVFDSSESNPKNRCFCRKSICPPRGIFNTAPCNFRLPVFVSYPHFTHADPSLREKVTGLNPDPEEYQTMMDITNFGIPVNFRSRIQINFFLNKSSNTPWLKMNDGTVLPLGWVEIKMGKLSDFFVKLLYHISYTIPLGEMLLQYTSLFFITICPILIYFMLKCGKYKEVILQ